MSPRTRQLLLLFGVVALVAVAGCADGLGGPDNDVDEDDGELEETAQADDTADDSGGEGETNDSDGETANESDDDADDDSAIVINDSDDTDDSASNDSGSESGDDGTASDDGTGSDDSSGSDSVGDGSDDGSSDDGQTGDESDDAGDDGQSDGDDEPTEPDQSLLTLTVVDENSEPIDGVDVYGEGEEHEADIPLVFEGETDEDGQYTDVIYENEYTVDLDHEAYNATTFEYTHDGEREVTVELEADGEETGELEFEVMETTMGGHAEGVEIEGERQEPGEDGEPVTFTTVTDEDGMAAVDVPYGTYDLEFDGDDYESMERQVEHRDTDGPTPFFEINLIPPEYDLTVTVVDEDGEPIDGVDIEGTSEPFYANQNDSFEVTGVDGSTTITTLGISEVTMDVTPTETDHEPETVSVSLRGDYEVTVELKESEDE